ncbi:PREDICTED: ubiquitin carboxyl-terminal hydrolase 21-like [Camelina sativa]|uniref:Ubiquitin carboxyl-terminal hydrolase n=1 Tax=Camelina sativa TaxID=90675 RepID=A0ABM0UIA2_CAMSA|nr:PREDICTED: ubiquitin carboxyl-terminal hydrolase 21-like [Camelina sativa]
MAEFNDPPSSDLSSSPKLAKPNKTIDDSSPTAPIRDLVTHSLSISSPVRQIQPYSPAKPDGSSSDKTLIFNSEENRENGSSDKTLITPQFIPPANNSENLLQMVSTSDSYMYSHPENRPPRRYIANYDYQSDDDEFNKTEPAKPLPFSWWYPKIEPTGVGAGLYNSGNTCFIASVLQCFTHTVPLIESLRSYVHQTPCNCGNDKFCVMQALRDHIELALRSSGYALSIDVFRNNLKHFSSDFMINHQEDAHEFLQSFLDKLERCCLDPRNKPGSVSSQDSNIVDNVFGGSLMSTLCCRNCHHVSNTFEPSLGWSLEIDYVDNLWSALDSFTCVELLEDQLTCDNCKEKVTKEKQLKFDKLPPVATFHLKRFKNDGVTMEKIFKHIEFPLELDLLPFMSGNQNPEVSTKYHLYAFVEHIGVRATFGHYSAYVRSAPETWHNFDDSKVTRFSEDRVLSQDAYILFYAREGTPWFASTFEQLKAVFEATPSNFSPKSVLDNSYESIGNSSKACNDSVGVSIPDVNWSDFSCREPKEEVFHSAESCNDEDSLAMIDALKSPEADESEKPFAETTQQREPESCSAGNKANIDESEKSPAETSQQNEPVSNPAVDRPSTDAAHVPMHKVQNQDISPKRKADENASLGGAYERKPKIQKPNSRPKRQGSFQIQRSHLQTKNQEETRRTMPMALRSNVDVDPKEKSIALSYLRKIQTPRSRMLVKVLGGSPIKKRKFRR